MQEGASPCQVVVEFPVFGIDLNLGEAALLAMGVATLCLAAYALANIRESSASLKDYYHSIPRGTWGPSWWRWQFRPTDRQALLLTFASVVGTIGIAVWFFHGALT
jgi:hypothetical protein